MQKELKITIPEGYEIDQEKSTFERIIFKKKTNKYSKTWKEFIENNPVSDPEYFIERNSMVEGFQGPQFRDDADKNLCKTRKEAEAFLALIQLKRLWHEYVDEFEGYFDYELYLVNTVDDQDWVVCDDDSYSIFSFPSIELAEEFLNNFKDLFEKIKPLFINNK